MKIAISGKGGVGKSTLAALLARTYAERGRDVLAVDADPAPCLARALGLSDELRATLHPIVEMKELIEERTGAKPGTQGGFFTINPRVDDIPERFSVTSEGVRLLEMGAVESGGSGCICPESAMLHTLFTHLLFRKDEVVLFDMYAGVEHLGRATVDFVDAMLIVVEPSRRSIETAARIEKLATDIGVTRLWRVANRVRNEKDLAYIERESRTGSLIGHMPEDEGVIEADRDGKSVYTSVPRLREAAERIADALDEQVEVSANA
jgi:CO dehydrogenase maturation factor